MGTYLSSDEHQEELKLLFQAYKKRHTNFYKWSLFYWLASILPRLLKKDPYRSLPGILLTVINSILIVILPMLVITSLTDSWNHSYMSRWILVSIIYGILMAMVGVLSVRADESIIELHGAMSSVQGLRRLIAWDHRWFNYVVETALALFFAILCVMAFFAIHQMTNSPSLPIGTQVLGLFVFLLVGATAADLFLLACETPLLIREEYKLFRHTPSQTLSLQTAMRGYNSLLGNVSLVITIIILLSIILLPPSSNLLMPVILMLLGLAYSSIILIMVTSRYLIGQIIRTTKERELAVLQARISVLWNNLPEMNENEIKELERLERIHDRLAATPHTLLNLGQAINTFIAAIFFPTLSTILSYLLTKAL